MPSTEVNPLKRKYQTAWEIARNKDYPDEASKLRALKRLEEEEKFEYEQQRTERNTKTTEPYNRRVSAITQREDGRGEDPLLEYQKTLAKVKHVMEEDFKNEKQKEFLKSANEQLYETIRKEVRLDMQFEVDQDRRKMVAAMNKEYEEKMGRLRGLVDSKLRPEFQKNFEQEKRDDMHRQVEAELRPVLLAKIREEEKELLKVEAEAELRPILLAKIREEEKEAMRAEVEEALRPDIEKEIRESIEALEAPRKKKSAKKSKAVVIINEDVPLEEDASPEGAEEPEVLTRGKGKRKAKANAKGKATTKVLSKAPSKATSKATAKKKSSQKVTTGRVTKNQKKKAVTKRVIQLLGSAASEGEEATPKESHRGGKRGALAMEKEAALPEEDGSNPVGRDVIPEDQSVVPEGSAEEHSSIEEPLEKGAASEAAAPRKGSTE